MTAVRVACEAKLYLPLNELQSLQGDLKEMSKRDAKKLESSFLKDGIDDAFTVWRGRRAKDTEERWWIVDGHGRAKVLRKMADRGVQVPDVPCVVTEASSYQAARKKILRFSSTYHRVTGDGLYGFLAEEGMRLESVRDFSLSSFDDDQFLKEYEDGDAPDDTPAADQVPTPPTPVTRPGDLWTLGEHRLVCGSSTDLAAVERLMERDVADMVVTDPPYGVEYESAGRRGKANQHAPIENDGKAAGPLEQLLQAAVAIWPLKAGGAFYVCSPPGPTELVFRLAIGDWLRECIVWVKDQFVFGRQDYHWRHESILYGWKPGAAHYFVDDRTLDTVWEFPRPKVSDEHPTMKPVPLFERAIVNSSRQGEIVFDGFSGSGTTILACERTQRRARAVELEPRYCDVALARWAAMTGQEPVRHDGARWADLVLKGSGP